MTRATEIVEALDLTASDGWDLRAMLLRRLAGVTVRDRSNADVAACVAAEALGLIDTTGRTVELTEIGRDVAEQLRPEPWVASDTELNLAASNAGPTAFFIVNGSYPHAYADTSELAERIGALLTEDDRRKAMAYMPAAPRTK